MVGYTIPKETTVCRVYPTKVISNNYIIKSYHYKEYEIYDNLYKYTVKVKGDYYYLINSYTDEEIKITTKDNELLVIQNEEYFVLSVYDKSNNQILYMKSNYYDSNSSNDIISETYDVPQLKTFGTIELENGEDYVYFTSDEIHNGMIDSDNNLYEIVFK